MADSIEPISLSAETRRRYLNYALSVITSRALPDVRDGLKPVQRRILYAMRMEGYRSDGRSRKCAGVIGEVTKSYHPHGPDAVYDALVRMAQDFTLRYPLVFGEGNFGSVDGDPPAAYRYTECRLMPLAEEMMAELDQKTVAFRPNFDGEKMEPVVLPARFPQLLVNGSTGIAVGMATNIPPHNLREVIKACLALIDNRDLSTAKLVSIHDGPIKGPDFPLGGRMITDQKTMRAVYETGHGSIKVQGEWKVETVPKPAPSGKTKIDVRQIVVTSIPYGVNKGQLLGDIGAIINDRKLPMVVDMVDESSLDNGMRIVIELKEGADENVVMAYLFKHTALQQNFACNFTCLVTAGDEAVGDDLQPRRLGIKEMLTGFLDFRFVTVKRRFEFELEQLRRRIHILQGFKIIFNDLDRALALIRESTGRADAAERLRGDFPLDEEQSLAIVDLNLYRIGSLEIKKILDELREKRREAKRIEEILSADANLWAEVRRELEDFAEKFGDKRRTRIADEEATPEFNPEAYIIRENANVVLSRDGWVKRVGRLTSVATTRVREGDEVRAVVPASTLDYVVFFSSDGFAYTMRVDEIPASTGYGEPLAKFFRLRDGVSIVAAFTTDPRFTPTGRLADPDNPGMLPDADEWQIVVATRRGGVSRLALTPFMAESTKAGRRYIRLIEGDEVVFVGVPSADETTMFLVSSDGHLIHFEVAEIPVLGGAGKGVRGIKLGPKALCLGGRLPSRDSVLTLVNTKGTEIEIRRSRYQTVSRGGKGVEIVKRGGIRAIKPADVELVDWSQLADNKVGS